MFRKVFLRLTKDFKETACWDLANIGALKEQKNLMMTNNLMVVMIVFYVIFPNILCSG